MCEEEEKATVVVSPPVKRRGRGKKNFVNLQASHYPIVHSIFAELGWTDTDSDEKCTLIWCDCGGSSEICTNLYPWQFYNHFQAVWSIARKVELMRNYEKMHDLLPDIYTFLPKSFLLPGQFSNLKQYIIGSDYKDTLIVKPDKGSRGRGIFLIQDYEGVENYQEMAVVQRYIPPFLVEGYKFDLRLYVLITAVSPLRIYFHNEGMARFCTEKYIVPKSSNLGKVYGHLTNYSLNKKNDHFEQNLDSNDATKGSKRSYSFILDTIKNAGNDVALLQKKIDRIVRLTIASIQPLLENQYKATISVSDNKCRCFEILGFDILVDENLNPWLIEVNNMPSLRCDSPFDEILKGSVVKGALQILNIPKNFRKKISEAERSMAQNRITGFTNNAQTRVYDSIEESEIAARTNWRQIYPINDDEEEIRIMDSALATAKDIPLTGPVETKSSKARKEHINREISGKIKVFIPEKKTIVPKIIERKKSTKAPTTSIQLSKRSPFRPLKTSRQYCRFRSIFQEMKGITIKQDEETQRMMNLRNQIAKEKNLDVFSSVLSLLGQPIVKKLNPIIPQINTITFGRPLVSFRPFNK